jgi:uncharacterized protein YdaU (DUF1376 family)
MSDVWYPRYVGDYQRKTGHLSMMEHGAYAMLLDHYYSTGGLPANAEQLHRICRALADVEQAAVHSVVAQFFERVGDRLVNKKAEEQLAKRRDVSEKRAKAAFSKHAKQAAIADANAYAEAPTIPQPQPSKNPEESKASSGGPRKRATRLPETWVLSAEDRAFAVSKGLSDAKAEREAEKFRNHWHAKGGRDAAKMDWTKTWQNWVLRDAPVPTSTSAAPADVTGLQAKTFDKMEAGFRSGRFYPVSMMDASTTEEMIRRGCLTREAAARHHYPLAADPIRRTA